MKIPFYRPAKFWPALGFAALAGSRATAAPAFFSRYLSHHPVGAALAGSRVRYLTKPGVQVGLELLLAAEIIGDKLPNTPNRTVPQQLGSRSASGALVGAALYKAKGGSPWLGALVGGLGAAAATYATWWLRMQATELAHGHSALTGAGEDTLVLAGGEALARS